MNVPSYENRSPDHNEAKAMNAALKRKNAALTLANHRLTKQVEELQAAAKASTLSGNDITSIAGVI